jgi:thiamine-monophosphate kinase
MLGEFDIIGRYFKRAVRDPSVVLGIGDDAAVLEPGGRIAITVDTLVAGAHFLDGIPPHELGYRSLAVNLSDLAAMGAEPRWCTLALTLPRADDAWLEAFAAGFFELAEAHRVSLVGGNLARGPLSVTVTALGAVDPTATLTRAGGRPGDDVYVTGTLGDGAAGIALIKERVAAAAGSAEAALERRFYRPTPRIAEGRALRALASAAIDVSDGLLADLGHLCTASACGAALEAEAIPLSAELAAVCPPQLALTNALTGGDDYELCFSAPRERAAAVTAALAALGTPVRKIGALVAGSGVAVRRNGEPFVPAGRGYEHFARS